MGAGNVQHELLAHEVDNNRALMAKRLFQVNGTVDQGFMTRGRNKLVRAFDHECDRVGRIDLVDERRINNTYTAPRLGCGDERNAVGTGIR